MTKVNFEDSIAILLAIREKEGSVRGVKRNINSLLFYFSKGVDTLEKVEDCLDLVGIIDEITEDRYPKLFFVTEKLWYVESLIKQELLEEERLADEILSDRDLLW